MEMTGEYHISAPRAQVWTALNDPDVLRQAIPGCESLEKISDTEMRATVTLKVGPVKARFKGEITLSDIKPEEGYVITGEGKGGAAGFAKGGAKVVLTQSGAETILNYEAQAQIGGKLAQLGSRLIDQTAKKMADDFFKRFKSVLEDADGVDQSPPQTSAQDQSKSSTGLSRRIIIKTVVLAGLIGLGIWLFAG